MTFTKFIKRFFQKSNSDSTVDSHASMPRIVSQAEHKLSQKAIPPLAAKILNTLTNAGFSAYLVGGCVRDLLLNLHPKDFDIVTNAQPEEIKALFPRHARSIGRRFPIVHVHYGREVFEVSTFRSKQDNLSATTEGMILRDNVYGTIEEDAWRRDFTINALYLNIKNFTIIDYTNGLADVQQGIVRMIGDPALRYREDPVRLLRALRFAAKLNFTMHADLVAPIAELKQLLVHVAPARLFLEIEKLFVSGHVEQAFKLLQSFEILPLIFPDVAESLLRQPKAETFIQKALQNTDERIAAKKSTTPAFLLAVLLWFPFLRKIEKLPTIPSERLDETEFVSVAERVIKKQTQMLAFPKFIGLRIREIWLLQAKLLLRRRNNSFALLADRHFRAAYDFLILRAMIEPELKPMVQWWTDFQLDDPDKRKQLIEQLPKTKKRKKKKRKE